jgi:phage shock protein PspC (stress-responsive transcriptional regulator)/predicted membrane protein
MIAGVATGMADAFHVDVVVIRVIWVVAAIATFGLAVGAYGVCWLAFPSEYEPAPLSQIRERHGDSNTGFVVGLVLLGIGAVFVLGRLSQPFDHTRGVGWALVLIAGGLAVLFLRHPDHDDDTNRSPAPPSTDAPTTPEGAPMRDALTETPPATDAPAGEETTAPTEEPATPPTAGATAAGTSTAWSQHSPWPAPPAPPSPPRPPGWARPPWRVPRRRRRSFLTPITLSVLLIGAGAVALLDSIDAVHVTLAAVLATALIVVGGALVLSAWFGRARGLIPIGVLLLLATIPASVIDVPISGGIGEQSYHPVSRAELHREYELGIGHMTIDLRDVPLSGRVTAISGSLGIGELDVDVPANVRVDVRAHVGAGATELFGHEENGLTQDNHVIAGERRPGVLRLELRVGAGAIKVHRWGPNGALLPA